VARSVMAVAVLVWLGTCLTQALGKSSAPAVSLYVYPLSQTLRMYQGESVILETHVSTGKGWGLPNSRKKVRYRPSYQVLFKDPRREKATSILVDKKTGKKKTVKTPWKLVLSWDYGHYVRIHEYKSVPKRAASHGCIRVPKGKAQRLYEAVEVGTKVYVESYPAPKMAKTKSRQKPKPSDSQPRR